MAATTTIKVPPALRDRINHDAGQRGMTAAALIEELVANYERRQRLEAFGRAFAGVDATYRAESEAWTAAEAEWPHG
jgi:predicted transcriptional regulator